MATMSDFESIAKVLGGIAIFGVLSKIWYDYKSGQIAKKKVKIGHIKKDISDAKRSIANLNLYELIKRTNKRFRSGNDPKGK